MNVIELISRLGKAMKAAAEAPDIKAKLQAGLEIAVILGQLAALVLQGVAGVSGPVESPAGANLACARLDTLDPALFASELDAVLESVGAEGVGLNPFVIRQIVLSGLKIVADIIKTLSS